MNPVQKTALQQHARILLAITVNDLLAALKNKNALTAFLLALAVVAMYRLYPSMTGSRKPQSVRVYVAGESALTPLLESSQAPRFRLYDSEEQMKEALANSNSPELGLVIPEGFDQALAGGGDLQLQGYRMNWASPAEAARLKLQSEEDISRLLGRPVAVQMEGNIVYPSPDSGGMPVTMGLSLIYVILMTALPMLPHLFMEEKRSRTMDALLVSPASAGQIVAGKAISGMFYCLLGAAAGLAIFGRVVVHWWLMGLSVLCGSAFVVAIGLWLGMRIESREQVSLAISVAILPLLPPIFILLLEPIFPAWLVQAVRFIPTTALFTLFRISAAGSLPWGTVLTSLGWISLWAAATLALVSLEVRRLDRQGEAEQPSRPAEESIRQRQAPAAPVAPAEARAPRPAPTAASPGTPASAWAMIWTIAAKDLRAAVRNKVFLSILMGTATLAGSNVLLSRLIQGQDRPAFVVYDQGRSAVLRGLAAQADFSLSLQATRQDMEAAVADGTGMALGLVLPPDFDQQVAGGQTVVLDGYLSHTADPARAREWADFFEQQLGQAGGSVRIELDGRWLYPSVDSTGRPAMAASVMAIVIFALGMALVPLLFIEEKEARTLDALLVSPAGFGQVVAGKALAGAAYCLLAAAVLAALNARLVLHWESAVLAILLTTFFAVALGLLVGVLSAHPAAAGAWGSFLLVALAGLTALNLVAQPGWPDFAKAALAWLPGSAALSLFRLSMAGEAPAGMLWANAGALLAAGLAGYGLVLWRISRVDR